MIRGRVVIIGTRNENARELQERPKRLDQGIDGLGVAQVVARVDHEVGLQVRQRLQPLGLLVLARDEVDVAQVQDAERFDALRKNGQGFVTDLELVLLPPTVSGRRCACCCSDGSSDGETAPDSADAVCQ